MTTDIDFNRFINSVTTHARIAFVLALAESVLIELKNEPKTFALGQEALSAAWKWEEKKEGTGHSLFEYVDSSTEKDFGVHELDYEDIERISSVVTITLALGYTTKHAFQLEGINRFPEPIAEITEETIEQVFEFASKTSVFNNSYLVRLYSFLLENYFTNDPSELGSTIFRETLMKELI